MFLILVGFNVYTTRTKVIEKMANIWSNSRRQFRVTLSLPLSLRILHWTLQVDDIKGNENLLFHSTL